MSAPHIPVMLDEVVAALAPAPGDHVVDGTFGAGGYARAILGKGAQVTGFDRDPDVIRDAAPMLAEFQGKLDLIEAPFSRMDEHFGAASVDGVVLDIGVSSMQIDQAERCLLDCLAITREVGFTRDIVNLLVECARLRAAQGQAELGLELGAEDYVTKPFSAEILLARARVALRAPARGSSPPGTPSCPSGRRRGREPRAPRRGSHRDRCPRSGSGCGRDRRFAGSLARVPRCAAGDDGDGALFLA